MAAIFVAEGDLKCHVGSLRNMVHHTLLAELPIKSESDSILDTPEKRVVEWKFSELDTDQDNQLRKKEIRSLTRMVRKLVKPKSCARNFVKHCDLDQNRKIARNEWSVCLGVDLNSKSIFSMLPF